MLARLEYIQNDAEAPLLIPLYNEALREACGKVYVECHWSHQEREYKFTGGEDQRLFNYPAYCGATDVIAVAVWDSAQQKYIPLTRRPITLALDSDPLEDIGGTTLQNAQGQPRIWDPKTQLEVWPKLDQAYEFKMDHTICPEFIDDETPSVVDADLIMLWALAELLDDKGEERRAATARQKYADRLAKLKHWAASGREIAIDASVNFPGKVYPIGPRFDFTVNRGLGG